jgi:hypothetical protein
LIASQAWLIPKPILLRPNITHLRYPMFYNKAKAPTRDDVTALLSGAGVGVGVVVVSMISRLPTSHQFFTGYSYSQHQFIFRSRRRKLTKQLKYLHHVHFF